MNTQKQHCASTTDAAKHNCSVLQVWRHCARIGVRYAGAGAVFVYAVVCAFAFVLCTLGSAQANAQEATSGASIGELIELNGKLQRQIKDLEEEIAYLRATITLGNANLRRELEEKHENAVRELEEKHKKLIEELNADHKKKIIKEKERENEIEKYKKLLTEKSARITELEKTLVEKSARITELEKLQKELTEKLTANDEWVTAVLISSQLPTTAPNVMTEPDLKRFLRNKEGRLTIVLVTPQITETTQDVIVAGGDFPEAYYERDIGGGITDSGFTPRNSYRLKFYNEFENALREKYKEYKVERLVLPSGKAYEDYIKGKKGDLVFLVDLEPVRLRPIVCRTVNNDEVIAIQDRNPKEGLNFYYAKLNVRINVINKDGESSTHGGSFKANCYAPPTETGFGEHAFVFQIKPISKKFRKNAEGALPQNYFIWRMPKPAIAAKAFVQQISNELKTISRQEETSRLFPFTFRQ